MVFCLVQLVVIPEEAHVPTILMYEPITVSQISRCTLSGISFSPNANKLRPAPIAELTKFAIGLIPFS